MTSPGPSHDVIVIGAGLNGLTLAALLAGDGRRVLLLERAAVVGGTAIGRPFHDDLRSAGLVHECRGLRPAVIAALDLERHGLERRAPAPRFVPAPAGHGESGLLLHHDPAEAVSELASVGDAERYGAYRAFFERLERFTSRFLDELPPDLGAGGVGALADLARSGTALRRLGRRDMMELLRMAPMSVADWLEERFEDDRLRSALAGPAVAGTFMGPRSPGSAANLLRWEAAGASGPVTDPESLVAALSAAAVERGVEVRTDAAVTSIRCRGGRVTGVGLADGEPIDASRVASTIDPRRTFLELLDGADLTPRFEHRLQAYRMRGTTAQVSLALDRELRFDCRPDLAVEQAWTAQDLVEVERAFDPVKYGRCSERPVLEIRVPSPDVVSILVHYAPVDRRDGWSDEARAELGARVIETLSRFAPDLPDAVLAQEVLAPPDLERRYGCTGGQIHQGEHALDQLINRPCPPCARYVTPVEGLFLCGGATHPGGGLAGVNGAIAAPIVAAG